MKRKDGDCDEVYKSLSEGEKTFVSFLYFYQLCLGTNDITHSSSKKKIIVIDDPVSSLDSNILFVITTLIHQLARYKNHDSRPNRQCFLNNNIEQIFILTHNYYFYKEVSFNKRPICTDRRYFVLEKINSLTKITSSKDSTIKNDYSMMWNCLKKIKSNMPTDKESNLTIANTMRRIIDSFVEFMGMKKPDESSVTWSSLNKLEEGSPEKIVESAFISFINDDSHSVLPTDELYYNNIIRQEPSVIFKAFKNLFKTIGREHYEMMMDEKYED